MECVKCTLVLLVLEGVCGIVSLAWGSSNHQGCRVTYNVFRLSRQPSVLWETGQRLKTKAYRPQRYGEEVHEQTLQICKKYKSMDILIETKMLITIISKSQDRQ